MAVVTVVLTVFLACSSDKVTPLGAELVDDLLGSQPGEVFEDTLAVLSDTVLAYGTPIVGQQTLELGRGGGYERVMILQPPFPLIFETRTVEKAELRLRHASGVLTGG